MLKPNEAAKQLQQWRLNVDEEEPLRHLEPKLNKLPKKFWLIACGLFNCNEQGEQDWEDETDRFGEEQLAAFAKLSKADRTKLLRALFGDLATDMEVTLNWLAKPLQSHGHFAPPFRGPVRQELLHKRQSEFVRSLSDLSCYDP